MHWAKVYHMAAVSLRLFNVYGRARGAPMAPTAPCSACSSRKRRIDSPFTVVGDGSQTRDFTYVTDVANAFVMAAESALSGEILNVGSGGHYSINQLVGLIGGEVVHVPNRPGRAPLYLRGYASHHTTLGLAAADWFRTRRGRDAGGAR